MRLHRQLSLCLALSSGLFAISHAQDDSSHRGRKYKAPPATSHIEVLVTRNYNGKPIANAAVVFHSTLDGRDEGNLEVKTNEDGKAVIDVIPTGSSVDVQVIADGFSTFADTYQVNEAERAIQVKMLKPRAQVSTYVDNSGKAATVQPGIQEPAHPHSPPVVQPPQPTNHTSDPNPIAPVDPNATPGNTQNPTPKPPQ
jgi:hypothetical protein